MFGFLLSEDHTKSPFFSYYKFKIKILSGLVREIRMKIHFLQLHNTFIMNRCIQVAKENSHTAKLLVRFFSVCVRLFFYILFKKGISLDNQYFKKLLQSGKRIHATYIQHLYCFLQVDITY